MLVDEINGDYMLERYPSGDYDWIPLYTHLVKELTDEEIREFITVFPMIFNHMDLMAFARAILRKAQEK